MQIHPIAGLPLFAAGDDLAGAIADRIIAARLATLEDFTTSLEPDERQKLESALDALLQRPEVAAIYRTNERKVSR